MIPHEYWKRELRHDGVRFPAPFVPRAVHLRQKGASAGGIDLLSEKDAQEFAVLFGSLMTPKTTSKGRSYDATFRQNFWADWQPLVRSQAAKARLAQTHVDDWDWPAVAQEYAESQKSTNTQTHTTQKVPKVPTRPRRPMAVIMDGREYTASRGALVDSPGIFVSHDPNSPWRGRIRKRLTPADVTLNRTAPLTPKLRNGSSKKTNNLEKTIVNKGVSWIASWKDALSGKQKYVYLEASSNSASSTSPTARSMASKFHKAEAYGAQRSLLLRTALLRHMRGNGEDLLDIKRVQCAVCFHMLDAFAVRPGHDRDGGTRGMVSLRVENVAIRPTCNRVHLDFVGKDSVRFMGAAAVPKQVVTIMGKLLGRGTRRKRKNDLVFDAISATDLNAYLCGLMPGLTAKVIRTFRASYHFEKALARLRSTPNDGHKQVAIRVFRLAAVHAAALCNHQRITQPCNAAYAPVRSGGIDQIAARLSRRIDYEVDEEDNTPTNRTTSTSTSTAGMQCWAPKTTLSNYIDPRCIFAFAKRHGVPVESLVPPKLAAKMRWAAGEGRPKLYYV
jgi:DNA topoisomerase-1